mmetsp:Transcript_19119/g.48932  ORF Transcript_19119/g.48932 Transcript_19119/m.48932 type:complete len:238 (+) Transcript_19119:1441-2154(+)
MGGGAALAVVFACVHISTEFHLRFRLSAPSFFQRWLQLFFTSLLFAPFLLLPFLLFSFLAVRIEATHAFHSTHAFYLFFVSALPPSTHLILHLLITTSPYLALTLTRPHIGGGMQKRGGERGSERGRYEGGYSGGIGKGSSRKLGSNGRGRQRVEGTTQKGGKGGYAHHCIPHQHGLCRVSSTTCLHLPSTPLPTSPFCFTSSLPSHLSSTSTLHLALSYLTPSTSHRGRGEDVRRG